MAQLDASSCGSVAAAGHRRAIDMAQLDTNGRRRSSCTATAADDDKGHVFINMNAGDKSSTTGSDDIPSCVVCMEPLEWVAVGPCGHRVVCSVCAARARSAPNSDHRCCICRALCPIVIVTNAAVAATNGVPAFSKMPAAFQDGRVGEYWYCTAMTAYFDDEWQYEATAKAAATVSLKQRQPPSDADDETLRRRVADDGGTPGNEPGPVHFLFFALFLALGGGFIGIGQAAQATGWGQRVAIVLGSAAVLVTLGSVLWFFLYKNGYYGEQDDTTR